MTEEEYVINAFDARFNQYKGKNIFLHGSRNYSEAIIKHFNDQYQFKGVITQNPLLKDTFQGIRAYHNDEISKLDIDIVILTERVKYANEAYQSIRWVCNKKNIPIYNMYGLNETEVRRTLDDCVDLDLSGWKKVTTDYNTVVFEVMDTLLYPPIIEKSIENELAIRPIFRDLITWLTGRGINVEFSLRKSFSEEIQINSLKSGNIIPNIDDHIIRRTGEDLSFRSVVEHHPNERILYIGSGLINECMLPRCYGIDTYRFIITRFDCLAPTGNIYQKRIIFDANLKQKAIARIEENDIISFDIFDTLLVRKTLIPEDVFELVEEHIGKRNYAEVRKKAERELIHPNIYDIYKYIQTEFHWDSDTTDMVLETELRIEKKVTAPRAEIVELLRHAIQLGKRVVLTSDMYLPESVLKELLAYHQIKGFDMLFISCDQKKGKLDGLYEKLINLRIDNEKILHIGNDIQCDGCACEKYEIESIIIPSALELALQYGWKASIISAKGLMERCLVGMTISELFQNPFFNPNVMEQSVFEKLYRFAKGVVGPLIVGHMTWLIQELHKEEFDGVLFFARDGWLPIQLYKTIQTKYSLPSAVYYYANRHSTFLCCADDEGLIDFIVERGYSYRLNRQSILTQFYNLPNEILKPCEQTETSSEYIFKHMTKIKKIAKEARDGYIEYSRKCDMMPGQTFAVVDFVSRGTTQFFLEKCLPYKFIGYYYGNHSFDSADGCIVHSYLQGVNNLLLQNYVELETFFSSPEPSVDSISGAGEIRFADEIRSKADLQELQIVLDNAKQYAETFFDVFYQTGEVIRSIIPEELYAAGGCYSVQRYAYDDWPKVTIKGESRNLHPSANILKGRDKEFSDALASENSETGTGWLT